MKSIFILSLFVPLFASAESLCNLDKLVGTYQTTNAQMTIFHGEKVYQDVCTMSLLVNSNSTGSFEIPICNCDTNNMKVNCFVGNMKLDKSSILLWNTKTNKSDIVGTCTDTHIQLTIDNTDGKYSNTVLFGKGTWSLKKNTSDLTFQIEYDLTDPVRVSGVLQNTSN